MNDKYNALLRLKVLEKIIECIKKDGLKVGITENGKLFVQNTSVDTDTDYGYAETKSVIQTENPKDFFIGQTVCTIHYFSRSNLMFSKSNDRYIQIKEYIIMDKDTYKYTAESKDGELITFCKTDLNKTIFLSNESALKITSEQFICIV